MAAFGYLYKFSLVLMVFVAVFSQDYGEYINMPSESESNEVAIDYSDDGRILASPLFGPLKFNDYTENIESQGKSLSDVKSSKDLYDRSRKAIWRPVGINPTIIGRKFMDPLFKNKRYGSRKRVQIKSKVKESDLGPMHDCRDFRECQHVLREFISTIMKMDINGRRKKSQF